MSQRQPYHAHLGTIRESGGQTYEPAGPMTAERMYVCLACGAVVTWPSTVLHDAWHRGDR